MPRGKQMINGTEYVYEYDSKWDSDKKYATHNRNYIGKMVDGVFVPNKTHLLQKQVEEQALLQKQSGPIPSESSTRSFFGATYLFDSIGDKLGVTQDLKKCFPNAWKQLLSLAYYLILEDRNPMSRFPKWARTHAHPYGGPIPSQRSSEILGMITEDAKQMFFKLQAQRRLEKEYLVYDTTSISSYSKTLRQVKYGYNKDHDALEQINLALLYGEESRLPVYFRKLPGNISDVKTVQKLLGDIDFLNLEKVNLVMDRGFYSEDNVNALYQRHYKFIMGARTSLKYITGFIDEERETIASRPFYSSKYRAYFTSKTIDWAYQSAPKRDGTREQDTRRMYLHLFYDDQRATDDKNDFNDLLDLLENEILTDSRKQEHEKLYDKYFVIESTPVRGVKLEPKLEAIHAAEKNYGFHALISNGIKDPLEALSIYRLKDLIEKAYGDLKERLNMRRTSVSSSENLEGKLFVEFLALIYLSYIKKAMTDYSLFSKYTLQEFLDELDVIECYSRPGQRAHVGEVTKKQIELYEFMSVEPPKKV